MKRWMGVFMKTGRGVLTRVYFHSPRIRQLKRAATKSWMEVQDFYRQPHRKAYTTYFKFTLGTINVRMSTIR